MRLVGIFERAATGHRIEGGATIAGVGESETLDLASHDDVDAVNQDAPRAALDDAMRASLSKSKTATTSTWLVCGKSSTVWSSESR